MRVSKVSKELNAQGDILAGVGVRLAKTLRALKARRQLVDKVCPREIVRLAERHVRKDHNALRVSAR